MMMLTGLMGIAALATGCSGGGVPEECTDFLEKTNAMTESMTGVSAMSESNLDQLDEEWDKLSNEEKEQATEACKQGLAEFENMEGKVN